LSTIEELLDRVRAGDPQAVEELLVSQRGPLVQFVEPRLESRLTARADAVDIVQETLLEVACRLDDYLIDVPMPFPNWCRKIAMDCIIDFRRRNYADKRDVLRETPPPPTKGSERHNGDQYEAIAPGASPSSYVGRKELNEQVRRLLEALSENDREVLTLRFLDQRTLQEIGQILGLSDDGVRQRQLRAVRRLKDLLDRGKGGSRL